MFIDARSVPDGEVLECDVCVIGAGAAGITIAKEFADGPVKVFVIESGDLDINGATQALYEGENIGLPYFALDTCRLRYFGGTTNHWAGYCYPFRESEFAKRSWLPYSGWPITYADVAPFYERTYRILGLPEMGWDLAAWERQLGETRLPLDSTRFTAETFLIRKVRFAEEYRQTFGDSANIHAYLNANVTEIETNDVASTVTGARIRTLAGNAFVVSGKKFVLATGGIENPRILLLSNRVQRGGLGNQNDLVGRFFMEHPVFIGGIVKPANPGVPVGLYRRHRLSEADVRPFFLVSEEVQEREQIEPVGVMPMPYYETPSKGVMSLGQLGRAVRRGEIPDQLGTHIANVISEFVDVADFAYKRLRYGQAPLDRLECKVGMMPVPNPDSRVTLGDEKDELGQRRVKLDWRLSEIDKRSVRRTISRSRWDD